MTLLGYNLLQQFVRWDFVSRLPILIFHTFLIPFSHYTRCNLDYPTAWVPAGDHQESNPLGDPDLSQSRTH